MGYGGQENPSTSCKQLLVGCQEVFFVVFGGAHLLWLSRDPPHSPHALQNDFYFLEKERTKEGRKEGQ